MGGRCVLPDGSVGDVCVSKSLHDDLDVEALAAARQWHLSLARERASQWQFWSLFELTFTLK